MKRILLLAAALVAAAVPVTYAHHSFSVDYHEDQMVTIEGEIQEFQYRNPHAIVVIRVQDAQGQSANWAAEWVGAGRLGQTGITAETLNAGDRVRIDGSPGRDPAAHRIHLKAIERPADGWTWAGRNRRR